MKISTSSWFHDDQCQVKDLLGQVEASSRPLGRATETSLS